VTNETTEPLQATDLTGAQRKRLRGMAHRLEPVVLVGQGGLNDGVIIAVKQALLDHELIKVQFRKPADKKGIAAELVAATGSTLCGLIGFVAILYRRHPEKPTIEI
jgi:RNA-binding protein